MIFFPAIYYLVAGDDEKSQRLQDDWDLEFGACL
jgi:hypothetical protein